MAGGHERRTVIFSGQVQGVGFRYTAVRIASRYQVSGYVRNLANGEVELVVEGNTDILDTFVGDLARQMSGYIESTRATPGPATGEFDGFNVRY